LEINFIELLILTMVIYVFFTVIKLESRLKGITSTLEQISKHVDLPESPVNEELRELIGEGNEIKAVKKAREAFGLSLVEGKQYVDALKMDKN